ncbi:MAG: bis(5'-nucleosyl)-tetraphosphatase [Candidatus Nealsonbacteria bacterium]
MPVEKSAGAVIFRKDKNNIYYLVLHYELGHWDFVKGKIERNEDLKQTITRETKEETGIDDLRFIENLEEKIEYFFKKQGRTIFKTVIFFLAETRTKEIKLSYEHIGFKWLPYDKALEQLTFENAKKVLKKVNDLIIKNKL